MRFILASALATLAIPALGARLSRNLSADEIRNAASIAAFGSAHRAWTAPDVPNEDLGLSLGVEASFVFKQGITDAGDSSGYSPRIVPVPRLWAAWEFPWRVTVSSSISPGGLFDGIGAVGLAGQFIFFRALDPSVSLSILLHYTHSDTFGDMGTHTTGLAMQASKDLDFWQPYAGLGLLVANATVNPGVAAPGVIDGPYAIPRPHFYVGMRLDLDAKLGFQLDFAGRRPSLALIMFQQF